MQRRSVDLPEPEAPMMVTTSPDMTSKSMSRRTTWSPNDLRRPSMRITGIGGALLDCHVLRLPSVFDARVRRTQDGSRLDVEASRKPLRAASSQPW